jgi:hypothetical protein
MAWQVAQELPGVRRVTPAYGKDWNDRLIHDKHPEQTTQSLNLICLTFA